MATRHVLSKREACSPIAARLLCWFLGRTSRVFPNQPGLSIVASFNHLRATGPSRCWLGRCERLLRRRTAIAALAAATFSGLLISPVTADEIKHPIAVFSGLDKITGRIITFEAATNETVQFGSLQITERACYSRAPTEAPQTDTFIEVDNIDANDHYKRIFTGWMFAGSPSLHALDHPVYDIWLLRCKGAGQLIPTPPEAAAAETPPPDMSHPKEAAKPVPPMQDQPATVQQVAPPPSQGPIEVGPPPGFVSPPARRTPVGNDGF